jgi:nitrate reductase gamma subunit
MSFLTILGVLLFHIAAIILIGGLSFKMLQYRRPLAPLKISTTPAAVTRGGVATRVLKDVTVFTSLFKPKQVGRAVPCRFITGIGALPALFSPSL